MMQLHRGGLGLPLYLVGLYVAVGLFGVVHQSRAPDQSLYSLPSGVGETTAALVRSGTLEQNATLDDLQVGGYPQRIRFFSAHRPLIPIFMGAVSRLANRRWLASIVKSLLLLPLLIAAALALARQLSARGRLVLALATTAALLHPSHLSQLAALDVEEAYIIPMLTALVVGVLLSEAAREPVFPRLGPILAGLLILTKSSMPAIAIVCALFHAIFARSRTVLLRYALAITTALLILALHALISSGRFTTAGSLDWWNALKGNNPLTAQYYGASRLDDMPLHLDTHPTTEWAFSDAARHETLAFVRTRPGEFLRLLRLKAWTYFFRLDFTASEPFFNHGAGRLYWLVMNLALRALLLGALGVALRDLAHPARRGLALFYLLFAGAAALPHVLGFGYLRHITILILPTIGYVTVRFFGTDQPDRERPLPTGRPIAANTPS